MTHALPERIPEIEQLPTRQHFTDVRHVNVRWEPYKPDGARQMKAKGRWQEQVGSGDYWRWQNCDRPAFAHDLEPAPDAANAELARAEAAEAKLAITRDALERIAKASHFYGADQGAKTLSYAHKAVGRQARDTLAQTRGG